MTSIPHLTEGCSYPIRAGNRVRPLVDGLPTYRRICAAIDNARHSVWLTVTAFTKDFQMPDGRGSLFDVLDRAAARGLDARVIFWRPGWDTTGVIKAFAGTRDDREFLAARNSGVSVRWDMDRDRACQHQKCWLIDAGQDGETAFVGGINFTPGNLGIPGHAGPDGGRHDVFTEITGPAATDVQHNFVQRWNGASERRQADGFWGPAAEEELSYPEAVSSPAGTARVQIQRTLPAGCYETGPGSPGADAFDCAAGETSNLQQYLAAIDAANRTIYLENQAVPVAEVSERLLAAAERNVLVTMLLPTVPEQAWVRARRDPAYDGYFKVFEELSAHPNCTLAGITAPDGADRRVPVYVHAKIMLVDDRWATIGSCNLHRSSLYRNAELNAAIWCGETVRRLRCQLFQEHLDRDTGDFDDRAALSGSTAIWRWPMRGGAATTAWTGKAMWF